MANVLLADDEPLALTLLQCLIDWKRLGLHLLGCAHDGDELFDMLVKNRPDIVITDICMPGKSGLEIIAKALEMDMPTRFLIISSYTNFAYAREAIQLGVEDFLPKPVNRAELSSALEKVLEKLNQPKPQEESGRKLIQAACDYIATHFEEHITLDSVASRVYVSSTYLSTLFKKETGTNFSEYLTDVRMKNAKRLMEHPELTIAQIAEQVGYKDVRYFSAVFQKYYQISPAQYRK